MTGALTAIGFVGAAFGIAILLVMAALPILLALPLPTGERRIHPRRRGIDSARGWADPGR